MKKSHTAALLSIAMSAFAATTDADRPFVPETAPASRVAVRLNVLPRKNMPFVTGFLDGKRCSLLFDTGATHTTFDIGFVRRELPETKLDEVVLAGETNVEGAPRMFHANSLRLGDAEFRGFEAMALDISPLTQGIGEKVDGIVGMNVIGRVPAIVSLGSRSVVFNPAREETAAFGRGIEREEGNAFTIAIAPSFKGKRLPLIVDSAATFTFLSRAVGWPSSRKSVDIGAVEVNGSSELSPEAGLRGVLSLGEDVEVTPMLADELIGRIGADTLLEYDMLVAPSCVRFRRRGVPPPATPVPPRHAAWIDTIPKETNERDCTIGSLEAKAHVRGLFARVETTITIKNPNPRPISAPLRLPLPDGGAVCGHRLEIDGAMVPAVAVPKERARVAFETEQRKGADPGLAEAVKGNVFQARVYPVPANGSRRIRVDYVAPLVLSGGDSAALSLPMPDAALESRKIDITVEDGAGAPELGGLGDRRFERAARVWTVSSSETNLTPRADVLVALPKLPGSVRTTERWNGEVFTLVSERTKGAEKIDAGENPVVVWDASASRMGDHEKEFEIVRSLVKGPVSLRILRNSIEPERRFANAEELIAFLGTVDYDGGTMIEPNLREYTSRVDAGPKILLFTDGMDTLSLSPYNSSDAFKADRMTAFVSGAERDVHALECLCGRVVDVGVWPDLPARTVEVYRSESTMGGFSPEMPVLSVAWAIRRAEQLSGLAEEHKDELMELGRRFGVASKACSLLVLESLDQWIRYDVEPPKELAGMHADWLEGRKGRMELTPEGKAERHLYALVDHWNERKAWHARDFRKDPNRKPRPAKTMAEGAVQANAVNRFAEANERRRVCMAAESREETIADVRNGWKDDGRKDADRGASARIAVKAWSPDTPWTKALDAAGDVSAARREYLALRREWAGSPAFILDSASWFYAHGDKAFAERVVSNLAELRVEDAALLRVMAWRLSEGGSRALEVDTLRRVLALRPEDPQSHRDLALALDRWARETAAVDPGWAAVYAKEALKHYDKTILTPWQRHAVEFASIALEERNAFAAWIGAQDWRGSSVEIPALDERLSGVLDCDMRVVMAWDSDETDVDIHVTEPDGEEAYFGNRLTFHGGWTSRDITDGYGPEEYEAHVAPKGEYKVRAHYYASHRQAVFGPATVTATIFTDWGRPNQKSERLSIRLDRQKQMIDLGSVERR